jgi:hypothetical protein
VIGAVDAIATLQVPNARLLPIVARADRDSPQVRAHFATVLVDGASLGQYLRGIHRALDDAR